MNELTSAETKSVTGGGIVAIGWAAYGAYRVYKAYKVVRVAAKAAAVGAGTAAYDEVRGD